MKKEIFDKLEEQLKCYAPTANVIRERDDEIRIEKPGFSSTVLTACSDCEETINVFVGSVPVLLTLAVRNAGLIQRKVDKNWYHAILVEETE